MTKESYLFTPILKDILKQGERYPYALYHQAEEKIFTQILKQEEQLPLGVLETFSNNKEPLYIKSSQRSFYQEYIQTHITQLIDDDTVSLDSKASLINDIASETMNDLFESEVSSENLVKIDSMVDQSIKLMLSESKAMYSMLKMTSYDYYTYTHCIDVASYAIAFGVYLNLSQKDLEVLGKAAMLHDIGKKEIDNRIITKNGKLTKEEFETVKAHPMLSVKILKEMGEENDSLLSAIAQHHEKCNGRGYPLGLKEKEISNFAKIVSICDVFNALTTKRTYKERMSSFSAFEIMCGDMVQDLSKEYLCKFINFMGVSEL